jgi:hypothetical protein
MTTIGRASGSLLQPLLGDSSGCETHRESQEGSAVEFTLPRATRREAAWHLTRRPAGWPTAAHFTAPSAALRCERANVQWGRA